MIDCLFCLFSSLFGSIDSEYLNVPVGEMQELDINSGDVAAADNNNDIKESDRRNSV